MVRLSFDEGQQLLQCFLHRLSEDEVNRPVCLHGLVHADMHVPLPIFLVEVVLPPLLDFHLGQVAA